AAFAREPLKGNAVALKIMPCGECFAAEQSRYLTGSRPEIFGLTIVMGQQHEARAAGSMHPRLGEVIRVMDAQNHASPEAGLFKYPAQHGLHRLVPPDRL